MTVSNQSKLEYFNSYGLVFNDRFYVHRDNELSCVNLDNVKKIKLVRRREIKFNLLAFIFSFFMLYFSFLFKEIQPIYMYLFYVGAASLLVSSFLVKKYCYDIIVLTIDYQPISIKVSVESKNDAKKIVAKVNEKLNSDSVHESVNKA
jgi:hypothetical protein